MYLLNYNKIIRSGWKQAGSAKVYCATYNHGQGVDEYFSRKIDWGGKR
jgi:hypothetical protein